ncbi:hypothetical protein MUP32_04765 [Candidatus Microgenomates bacterium]|nr:hypothetical protein [Candidatus Microgenomates bacterium]
MIIKDRLKSIQKVSLLSILFSPISSLADNIHVLYGPPPAQALYGVPVEPTLSSNIIRILSYALLPVVIVLSLILGLIFVIKRIRHK